MALPTMTTEDPQHDYLDADLHTFQSKLPYTMLLPYCPLYYGAFPPWGAGQFSAGREGAVLLRSVTCPVSTTDSTLMVGGV